MQVIHFLGTWKLYQKAGRKPWEALVPIYNAVVLMRIINRPRWWVLLLFIPVVNLIMFPVVWVETLRSFGKNSTMDTILGIVTLGFYIYYINYFEDVQYVGSERDLKPRTQTGDTVSSLLFAVVVATLVHTYVMQPFTIPTSSLEKTLLVGDFLFVSKFHYGARTPQTTVALPMVHDSIPLTKMKSYSSWPQLPYFRFPGVEKIEKNDIVVFNWPIDTVRFFRDRSNIHVQKPVDKRSNYVKRCVATPGDTFSLKDGIVYINGKELILSDRAKPQYFYPLETTGEINDAFLKKYDITEAQRYYKIKKEHWDNNEIRAYFRQPDVQVSLTETSRDSVGVEVFGHIGYDLMQKLEMQPLNKLQANLTSEKVEALKKDPFVKELKPHFNYPPYANKEGKPAIFPHTKADWTGDNMGPVYIPEAGKTVELNAETLPFYSRAISEYEHNDLQVTGNEIRINGKPATSYTFKQNYYWMMGDNRHNSEDSRFWGFVPEDHIVGKPVFVWMSWDSNATGLLNKIRWERLFTTVGGDGEPVSYFKYFLILLAGWFVFDYFRKKRKAAKS
jgi:signal peptidase I